MIVEMALAGHLFVQAVAARCSGESSRAVHACACTVRNRLAAGWSERRVLEAYYAPDVRPTEQALAEAERGLSGEGCEDSWYFIISPSDAVHLGWDVKDAVGSVGGVLLYPRSQWGRHNG